MAVHDADGTLAAVLEASDDAIIVVRLDGSVLCWSTAAERLYGYRPDDMHGRSASLLFPEGHRGDLTAILLHVRAGGSLRQQEAVARTKRGQLLQLCLSATPVLTAGAVAAAVLVARDVTDATRNERAQRTMELRWRSIIESAVDGIVVIDAQGRIEAFNPAAERLFGYTEPEVVGRNVSLLMPAPYRDEHDAYLHRYLREGAARIIGIGRAVQGRKRDGTVFPLHLSVGEMSVDRERKFTGILHDLSAREELERQLREQEALARLGEMAAVLAHEIRNPLAGIRGAMQVLSSRMDATSQDASVTREIIARVDTLTELMQDLLLFARPPQPRPGPVDLAPLVTTTVDLLSQDPAIRGVRIDIHGTAPVAMADAELLKIVFQNLLINGAHAMGGRGEIRVLLGASNGQSSVTFADRGPGIPPEIRDKVFTPFFTTKTRGTGLGLPTAKRLIEAQRGTIALQCPPSGGTSVTIQLPAR